MSKTIRPRKVSKKRQMKEIPQEVLEEQEKYSSEILFQPTTIKLPELEEDIFSISPQITFGTHTNVPLFKLGYHQFYTQSKEKTSIFDTVTVKQKHFFYVVNPFEHKIDNYDRDIEQDTLNYFKLDQYRIASRGFYKMWEIIHAFDLIDLKTSNFVSAHLAECPGGFTQAAILYRQSFAGKLANQDYYSCISIYEERDKLNAVDNNVIDYMKNKKGKLYVHPVYPAKEVASQRNATKSKLKDTGDLTDLQTIKNYSETFKNQKADLVSGDAGFDFQDEVLQEQESYALILGQIITAVKIQKKGGNFVCKFFEMFTLPTMKFLCLLKHYYVEVYLYKPLISRITNSERYAVCKDFKYDLFKSKTEQSYLDKLEKILVEMKKTKGKMKDIFPQFKIPSSFAKQIIPLNLEIANKQFKMINEIITYIKSNNYYGDAYFTYRQNQITANKFWLDLFYPSSPSELNKNQGKIQTMIESSMKRLNKESQKL